MKIIITSPRKPYLKVGEVYEVVGFTDRMRYPYVMVDGIKRYVSSGEYKVVN